MGKSNDRYFGGRGASLIGCEVQVNSEGKLSEPQEVDTDGMFAWKNGFFHFERADLHTVMRTLAWWYDVDVQYEGPATSRLFGGDIKGS